MGEERLDVITKRTSARKKQRESVGEPATSLASVIAAEGGDGHQVIGKIAIAPERSLEGGHFVNADSRLFVRELPVAANSQDQRPARDVPAVDPKIAAGKERVVYLSPGATKRLLLRMVTAEQQGPPGGRMSHVLWDTFTGSAPYRDVFLRALHPFFLARFLYEIVTGVLFPGRGGRVKQMSTGALGKLYPADEIIVRQGEVGHSMFVIQSGKVEVIKGSEGHEICLAELSEGDFFGEMELFGKEPRAVTVRALTEVRVLTIDQKLLLRKIQEDPSLGFRIIQRMSTRIRELENDLMGATRARLDDAQQMLTRAAAR